MTEIHTELNISIRAKSIDDAIQALAGKDGRRDQITHVETDTLLTELRERMAKQVPPMVVKVLPFDTGEPAGATTENQKGSRRRNAKDDGTKQVTAQEGKTTEVPKEPEFDPDAAPTADAEPSDITMDVMRAALNDYSGKNGHAKTRETMQAHGGALRLVDIKPDNYATLLKALKA